MNVYTSGIIRREDKFLCIHHRNPPRWIFAGGKPEANEKAVECLCRELKEELNIEVVELEFFQGYLNEVSGVEWIGLFFKVCSFVGIPTLMEPEKHDDMQWLTEDEMRERTAAYPEMGIASFLSSIPPSPHELHLWTDEEVEEMKAKGIITEGKPEEPTPGKCYICGEQLKEGETKECFECSIPF